MVGMGAGVMGRIGGALKLYYDILSLIGYTSLLLIMYKAANSIKALNWVCRFFEYTSNIGYEWYLVHCLTFSIVTYLLKDIIPLWLMLDLSLLVSYVGAWFFNKGIKLIKI